MREATSRPGGSRLRGRLDPVLPLVGLVSLLVYVGHGFNGTLTRDLAVYSYGGQQVADGVAPYIAIINRSGPLAHLIPGVGAWISDRVGLDDLLGMRILFLLIAVATVMATYVLGRDLYRSRPAGVVAAAALLCVQGFVIYSTNGPREKTPLVTFVVIALIASVRLRWAVAGAFVSLATLTWQPVFFPLAAGCAAMAVILPERRLRSLMRFIVGGLVPLAVTIGAYAAIGKLRFFLEDFIVINAKYTVQDSVKDQPQVLWDTMTGVYGWSLWVLLLGLGLQLVWAVRVLARRTQNTVEGAYQVAMAVFVVVGVLWAFKAFNGWPDFFIAIPLCTTAVAGLVPLVSRLLPARAVLAVVGVWAVVVVVLTTHYAMTTRDDTLVGQRRDVTAVMSALPGARIFSVEAPQPLVLAHQRNGTRFQLFGNGLEGFLEDTWPGGGSGYARWIVRHHSELIALGTESSTPRWFAPTITDKYTKVGESHGWKWYARDDLPRNSLDKVRRTLREG